MTQKELLYVEDAICHEDILITCINDIIKRLDDDNLIDYMKKDLKTHKKMKDNLINLLKENINE